MRLVMVEGGRFPAGRCVAVCAMSGIVLGQELAVMGVLVTRLAFLGRTLEAGLRRSRRLVAISTRYRTVGAQERELGLRMIESVDIGPGLRAVARLTTK